MTIPSILANEMVTVITAEGTIDTPLSCNDMHPRRFVELVLRAEERRAERTYSHGVVVACEGKANGRTDSCHE
jgi:hypothetical protein